MIKKEKRDVFIQNHFQHFNVREFSDIINWIREEKSFSLLIFPCCWSFMYCTANLAYKDAFEKGEEYSGGVKRLNEFYFYEN